MNKSREVTQSPSLALVGCRRCGLVFSYPQPTAAELEAYYGEPDGWESRMQTSDGAEERTSAQKLAEKHQRYSRELELLSPHLPGRDSARRTLDFGCGIGAWLDVLQDNGWETWGIEPGPQQRELAGRRHRMLDGPPSEPTFDLVVINHVLEHLRDPLAIMRSLATATLPGGRVFVSVPDLGRLGQHGKWSYVKSERHICSYTASSMQALLGLAGFRFVAHFDGSEWDAIAEAERWRLKMLAERTGEVLEPSGDPLEEAVSAMRAYAVEAERFAREKRARKAEERRARARPRESVLSAVRERFRR